MHALKILSEDDRHAIVGGYGVVFGGVDLEGETFTPETDYMLDLAPVKPVYIDHSQETEFVTSDGKRVKLTAIDEAVGQVIEVTPDDVGLYMRMQIDKAGRYWRVVEEMIGTEKAGLSSGTIGHLARRNGKTITRWPLVEESITLTPAEPRTVGVERLKALVALNPGLKAIVPEAADGQLERVAPTAAVSEAGDGGESLDARRRRIEMAFLRQHPAPSPAGDYSTGWWVVEVFDDGLVAGLDGAYWRVGYTDDGRVEFAPRNQWVEVEERREWAEVVKALRGRLGQHHIEVKEMSDTTPTPDGLKAQVDGLSESVNKIIKAIEDSPALKSAGYATDDGGAADPTHKSFGDFLLAVKRGDVKRLTTVYKARRDDGDTKAMYEAAVGGGYLVPEAHSTQLLELAAKRSVIYDRVTRIPVTTAAGKFPSLNQFAAPTAGSGETAYAAGLKVAPVAELETLPEVQPTFAALEWRVHKVGGVVEVSNELNADSAVSIEALLRRLFAISIASKNERNILRGSGVGEPMGILNSPTAIGITTAVNDQFTYADVLAMLAQFEPIGGGDPVWIMHRSVMPDLGVLAVASGSPVVWAGNLAGSQPGSLAGYPIIFSEHMPRANNDDVILADLSAYVLFERAGLSVAYSEHAAFEKDAGVWRFTARNDGQPWHKGPITMADPTGGYTASPFVYHND